MKKKLFVTGGHITPAIAVIEEIRAKHPAWQILFIGRKYAIEGSSLVSEEYRLINQLHIPFLSLTSGRVRRSFDLLTLFSLAKVPFGFLQACYFVLRYRPEGIVSFGGYIAFPVCMAGYLFRIPILTHEQTLVPGLANKIIERFATVICVSFPSTMNNFSRSNVVYTGLPLRKQLFENYEHSQRSLPILYITGGATGAKTLNELVYPILAKLCRKYIVVHQVGRAWEKVAKEKRSLLRGDIRKNYIVAAYHSVSEHSRYMHEAHIFLGRSGANTVIELAALGKVCIFVPLPWSGGNEQQKNAQWLECVESAIVVDQYTAQPSTLFAILEVCEKNYKTMESAAFAHAQSVVRDASSRIVQTLDTMIS